MAQGGAWGKLTVWVLAQAVSLYAFKITVDGVPVPCYS